SSWQRRATLQLSPDTCPAHGPDSECITVLHRANAADLRAAFQPDAVSLAADGGQTGRRPGRPPGGADIASVRGTERPAFTLEAGDAELRTDVVRRKPIGRPVNRRRDR